MHDRCASDAAVDEIELLGGGLAKRLGDDDLVGAGDGTLHLLDVLLELELPVDVALVRAAQQDEAALHRPRRVRRSLRHHRLQAHGVCIRDVGCRVVGWRVVGWRFDALPFRRRSCLLRLEGGPEGRCIQNHHLRRTGGGCG